MTFAGQVFEEGWIAFKAQYYSLLHGRGSEVARERVYKLLPTGTFPSLNHIIRLDSSVALVVNSKSNSKKTGHGCSRPRTGRLSELAGSMRGEHAKHPSRYVRRDLASLWVIFVYQTMVLRFLGICLEAFLCPIFSFLNRVGHTQVLPC